MEDTTAVQSPVDQLSGYEGGPELCMESRGLESLPPDLLSNPAAQSQLKSLCLPRNRIVTIPVQLYTLAALELLDLSRNHLSSLPAGISNLTRLKELNLLSNSLKLSTLPLDEMAAMTNLETIDLRYNEKLQKQEAAAKLRGLFGSRLQLVAKGEPQPERPAVGSACDRDANLLQDQLAPWSTPHLRKRLLSVFGVDTDPDTVGRNEIMRLLLQQYATHGPRQIRQHEGTRVHPTLAAELTACLRCLTWPTTTRERPKVQAERYFTLQVPNTKFTVEGGKKAKLNAAKLQKYAVLWELIIRVLRSVDPGYADVFTGVAVTCGFTDSPHIDTENIGPFYAISVGDFTGGGCVAVESSPLEITHVNTFERLGRVDGRYPHWVTPYTGERYSVIYYRTVGEVDPMGPAVFEQPAEGAAPVQDTPERSSDTVPSATEDQMIDISHQTNPLIDMDSAEGCKRQRLS